MHTLLIPLACGYFTLFLLTSTLYSQIDPSFPPKLRLPISLLLFISSFMLWCIAVKSLGKADGKHATLARAHSCPSMDKYGTWGKIKGGTCFRHLPIERGKGRVVLETRHFQRFQAVTGDKVL